MTKIFIGIDPGLTGAIGSLDSEGKVRAVIDTPILDTISSSGSKRSEYNIQAMGGVLKAFINGNGPETVHVALEGVQPFPKAGVVPMFGLGRGLGLWEGILTALGFVYTKIRPQDWKAALMRGMRGGKETSIVRAQQLFPDLDWSKKKYHGRADSLLLAEYLRRTQTVN